MVSGERYRQYAADCVKQAQSEGTSEDKTIMLNVALAWLRLAQQRDEHDGEGEGDGEASPSLAPEPFDLDEQALFNKIAN
jgi:hypothetical protein